MTRGRFVTKTGQPSGQAVDGPGRDRCRLVLPRVVRALYVTLAAIGCVLVFSWWLRASVCAASSRVALVVGVSSYDARTQMPELPQAEMSARELGGALAAQVDTTTIVRRIPVASLLREIREVAGRCPASGELFVFLLGTTRHGKFLCSDGPVSTSDLRRALLSSHVQRRVLFLDAADSGKLAQALAGNGLTVLSSSGVSGESWCGFFTHHDCARFESGAVDGWVKALKRTSNGWKGDIANNGALTVEDLQTAGNRTATSALLHRDERHALESDLGVAVLDAVVPESARKLREGHPVKLSDLRHHLGNPRYAQFAGVIDALLDDHLVTAGAKVRARIRATLRASHPMQSLLDLHTLLLHEHLLETPGDTHILTWKRLELRKSGARVVELVTTATQRALLYGDPVAPILGQRRGNYPWGTYAGRLSGRMKGRMCLHLTGPYVTGRWEGEISHHWLRGTWMGTYDARTGKLAGRVLGLLQSEKPPEGNRKPVDEPLPGIFEGTVSRDGLSLSGTWHSLTPRRPWSGHWRVSKGEENGRPRPGSCE